MSTYSIPTTGINGIRFRSRIEAQWAEMFTKLGWDWEYEPIDLNGYIPDFIIKFPNKHLLVEVKGDTNMVILEQYTDKIVKSGWDGEFLLVCSVLDEDTDGLYLGLMGSTKYGYIWKCSTKEMDEDPDYQKPYYPTIKGHDYAYLATCYDCASYTIYNSQRGWFCRNCGSGPCNKSLVEFTVKKELVEKITKCINCKKYDEDVDNLHKMWRVFREKNDVHCDCHKFVFGCVKCNPYRNLSNNITRGKCECEYENKYDKVKRFWVDAKNHSQWKGK